MQLHEQSLNKLLQKIVRHAVERPDFACSAILKSANKSAVGPEIEFQNAINLGDGLRILMDSMSRVDNQFALRAIAMAAPIRNHSVA